MPQEPMQPPVNGPYVPFHSFDGYNWGAVPAALDRLNQGPFDIFQDAGWRLLMLTMPAEGHLSNFGMGLVGYAWEENGPPPVEGQTLEESVTKLAKLPFCDKLYIRCDWRDVQSRPGRLDLNPVFKVALSLCRELRLGLGLRVQMSSPNICPTLAIPDFLAEKVPLVTLGKRGIAESGVHDFVEPEYHHREFQKAFRDLNELLAAEFDDDPAVEWMDLMQYGLWGEGHSGSFATTSLPDYATALETFLGMTRFQIETWKKTPLAVNSQPDISRVGNDAVIDLALRAGCWLRTDSIITEESQQFEMISNRPPFIASIVEDGGQRRYDLEEALSSTTGGVPRNDYAMFQALDSGATHWALWQMADNLAAYHERFPRGVNALQNRIGYRVRPSRIWERKRYGRRELIVGVKNDGVAGVPGTLRLIVESPDGKVKLAGTLDPGHPLPGKLRQASFLLPEGVEGEGLTIRAEIETKGVTRPVRWASAEAANPDGSLTLTPGNYRNPNWRKDV